MTQFPTRHNPDQVSAPANCQTPQTNTREIEVPSPSQKIPVDFHTLEDHLLSADYD